MKKVRVYYNGKRLRDMPLYATKWQILKAMIKNFLRKVFIGVVIISTLVGVYKLGSILSPKTIFADKEVIKEVEMRAPVMDRIAMCESSNQHFENGQVKLNGNKNTSVDIGKYQINSDIWGKTATDMGYDLMKEKDNEAFAYFIFKNYGTAPWKASAGCWYR